MNEIVKLIPEWVFNTIILISVPSVICYAVWKVSNNGR